MPLRSLHPENRRPPGKSAGGVVVTICNSREMGDKASSTGTGSADIRAAWSRGSAAAARTDAAQPAVPLPAQASFRMQQLERPALDVVFVLEWFIVLHLQKMVGGLLQCSA